MLSYCYYNIDMIEETGVVIKAEGNTARIRVQRRGSCEGCAAMGTCEVSEEGMEVEALNPVQARVGQTVKVAIAPQSYLKGVIFIYGIPLFALIAGAIIGKNIGEIYIKGIDSDVIAALTGFSAFFISFLLMSLWAKKTETKAEYKPVIEKIVDSEQ